MMKVLVLICLQFSPIHSYIDFPNDNDNFLHCRTDADCGSNPFVNCLHQDARSGWGQCRIPWDFGKECKTDHDCVRGSSCDAIYCHGQNARFFDDPFSGLKK